MRLIHAFIFTFLFSSSANAQFSFDKEKIKQIRWSPIPVFVENVKEFKLDLNGTWKFSPSPPKDFFTQNNHSTWENIKVPGEWVMQGYIVKSGEYAGYSRSFTLPQDWKNKRIILKCEAIYSECSIWINQQEAGRHLGGMTSFETDITSFVKNGENNITIAVRSESMADTLSSASQYAVHPLGGITRPIHLLALPEVNVASFHVTTTFDYQYRNALLRAELKLSNETLKKQKTEISLRLSNSSGKMIEMTGENAANLQLDPKAVLPFILETHVTDPLKWDPEHPNLYTLECTVKTEGKVTSKVLRRFGFRQIEVRGNQVFVNNLPIKLKGVCRHEVAPNRGRSLVGNIWYEDVKIFKEGNVNYIRTSHYPPNEKLLEACDELGMFVEEEAPFCWATKKKVNDRNYFETILQPTLEMVERDRSHPSIIIWSLANESENFEELFRTSADLVKAADPSRLRNFSQYGPDGDGGYLEIGNHHYPGPTGPLKYHDSKRPITFDEYCHLNAYNRYELITDPGVRDYWGNILLEMWEGMYHSKGVLGGALWAGIDDSFFLPDGSVVGYGTWGPIDGWRRPKPEYWHMKKVFTPVKANLVPGQQSDSVALQFENRFFFSNLNECVIKWKNGENSGEISPNVTPGGKMVVNLPITYSALQKMSVDIYKGPGTLVDEYLFDFSKPTISEKTPSTNLFVWNTDVFSRMAESSKIKVEIAGDKLIINTYSGKQILSHWPSLMLVSINNGGDTQMTPATPDYSLFSPAASNRKIESVEFKKGSSEIILKLTESYKEAAGEIILTITTDGDVDIAYDYVLLENINCRQWGISFTLPKTLNILGWKRKGLWSVYPDNHIGRNKGTAKLSSSYPLCGLAGPLMQPSWAYNEDQTKFGSNDFRSTKRNIFEATLKDDDSTGLRVISDGTQHVRCWAQNDQVNMLVAEYDNPGAERFLRSHVVEYDRPLKQGQRITGKINLQILSKKLR